MSVSDLSSDGGAIARAVHVLAVVIWIGGVSMVRLAVLLTGASGLYMLHRYGLWSRFLSGEFWRMHLMIATWLLFSAVLFSIEPLLLHHWVRARGKVAPQTTLTLMLWLHRALPILSLVTIAAAVVGSHGSL